MSHREGRYEVCQIVNTGRPAGVPLGKMCGCGAAELMFVWLVSFVFSETYRPAKLKHRKASVNVTESFKGQSTHTQTFHS